MESSIPQVSQVPTGPAAYYKARRLRESPNAISLERALDQINALTTWLCWLGPNLPSPIQNALDAYLCVAKANLLTYRNNLVVNNEGLVGQLVHQKYRQLLISAGIPLEDAMQEGIMSLTRAADLFDVSRKWKFSTYAMYWIRQALNRLLQKDSIIPVPEWILRTGPTDDVTLGQKHCRRQAKAVRKIKRLGQKLNGNEDMGCPLAESIVDKQTTRLYEKMDAQIDLDRILSHLQRVPRRAIEMYYLEGLTLDEVASALVFEGFVERAVTRERMRQIIYTNLMYLKEVAREYDDGYEDDSYLG